MPTIRKTKVCIVSPNVYSYFNPKKDMIPGGAERQMHYLCHIISQNKNFASHACVADFGQQKKEMYGDVTCWASFRYNQNSLIGFYKLMRTLRKINADLYVFRSVDFGLALTVFFIKKIFRKKCMYMVANIDESDPVNISNIIGSIGAKAMSWVYKNTDILTVQSNDQFNAFISKRNIKPTMILHNRFSYGEHPYSENINKKSFLWVGRCDELKQCEYYIQLAQHFENENFVMICPKAKNEIYYQKIKTMSRGVNNLKYIDHVDPNEVYQYYQNAYLYILTSKTEGFANTMLEALAYGCPVLTLNVNPDNILTKNEIGYCSPNNDFIDLCNNCEKLLNDKKLHRAMSTNALQYTHDVHLGDNEPKALLNIIQDKVKLS